MERVMRCAICGLRLAGYSCRNCGANVCENCFDKAKMLCITCASRTKA